MVSLADSSESKPEYSSGDVSSANYGTEIEGDSQAGGRQSGDSESSKYGDTVSSSLLSSVVCGRAQADSTPFLLLRSPRKPVGPLPSLPRLRRLTILFLFSDINNEYPSSAEEGANFSTDSNSASFGLGGSSSATSADGGRTSEEGDYTGGGEYEGAKGYGLSQVEKSEPEQGVFRD